MSHITVSLVVALAIVAIVASAPVEYKPKPSVCNETSVFWTSKCNYCQCQKDLSPMCMAVECPYDLGASMPCQRWQMVKDPKLQGECCDLVCPAGSSSEEEEELVSNTPSHNSPIEEEVQGTAAAPSAPTPAPFHSLPEEEIEVTVSPSPPPQSTVPTTITVATSIPTTAQEEVEESTAYPTTTSTPSTAVSTTKTRATSSTTTAQSQQTISSTIQDSLRGCKRLVQNLRLRSSFPFRMCSVVLGSEKMRLIRRGKMQFLDRVPKSKTRRVRRDS